MTALITAVLLVLTPVSHLPFGRLFQADSVPGGLTVEEGILSQYAAGVMPGVVAARQEWGELPADLSGIDGFIAVWNCDHIGRTALLSIEAPEWADWKGWSDYQTVQVSDCSGHKSTTDWMISANVVAEISGELAFDHGVVCLCGLNGRLIWLE